MKSHGNNITFAIMSLKFTRILITILFLYPMTGYTEIYKWVDENGKVHFDDRPGSGNKEKIKIKTTETSEGTNTEFQENVEQEKKLLKIYEEERQEKNLKKVEQREEKKKLKERCIDAKDYKKTLDESSELYDLDEKGERINLSTEEKDA
jgi:hypothetical protein